MFNPSPLARHSQFQIQHGLRKVPTRTADPRRRTIEELAAPLQSLGSLER